MVVTGKGPCCFGMKDSCILGEEEGTFSVTFLGKQHLVGRVGLIRQECCRTILRKKLVWGNLLQMRDLWKE